MNSLQRILAWRLDQGTVDPESSLTYTSNGSNKYAKGTKVNLRRVIGHRDVGETACPGNPLQSSLPWLRTNARKNGLPKMFEARLSVPAITPNGDETADALRFRSRFSSTMNWKTSVIDAAGKPLYTVSGSGTTVSVAWSGKNSAGALVPHGVYRFRVTGKGSAGTLRTYDLPFSVYRWPNGTFFYTSSKVSYLLYGGQLRRPSNYQARQSRYGGSEYVSVPDSITSAYPLGRSIGWRSGSLVSADGNIYLISDGRRLPTTKAVLTSKGFDTRGIIATTAAALAPHATGPSYTKSTATYPNGSALRSSTQSEAWMVGGVARPFMSRNVRASYLIRELDIAEPADQAVAAGATSPSVGFRDGSLIRVTNGTTIYMVSDGKRRAFSSSGEFGRMGFKSANIRSVTPAELALHDPGAPL
jgi:hypothetical protein